MNNPQYDTIIIGSSPLSMLEAISLGILGEKVLILDRSAVLGGAWLTNEIGGYAGVDTSPHILEPGTDGFAYDFVKNTLGMEMINYEHQPYFIKNKKMFDARSQADRYLLKQPKTIRQWVKFIKLKLLETISGKVDYNYFRDGTDAFIGKLSKLLHDHDVETLLNCNVSKIIFCNQIVYLFVSGDKKQLSAKRIVITGALSEVAFHYETSIKQLVNRDSEISYISLSLVLKNSRYKCFSYIKFLDDPLIVRVADVSEFVKNRNPYENDEQVLCLQIVKTSTVVDSNETLQRILDCLISYGIIKQSTELLHMKWNHYENDHLKVNAECLKFIARKFPDKVKLLNTKAVSPNMSVYGKSIK